MDSRTSVKALLVAALIAVAGFAFAGPAQADGEVPRGGAVSTNGFTWSN
ncbi:hypothetical protein AB0J42_15805 [Nonomuraea sp. NPDC049649]